MDAVIAMCSWYGLDVAIAKFFYYLILTVANPYLKHNAALHDQVRLKVV